MPELREDYLTGEWVSIAEARGKRPVYYKRSVTVKEYGACPFCPENISMTPEEIYRSPSGKIRIVPNKYPLVEEDDPLGYGFHEVIIDTPSHDEKLRDFSDEHLMELFVSFQSRLCFFYDHPRVEYVQIFKNEGMESGASVVHSHWQMAAMPFVPLKPRIMREKAKEYYDKNHSCYLCGQINEHEELAIAKNQDWIALAPYASKFPYETHILPAEHLSDFRMLTQECCFSLGNMLRQVMGGLHSIFPDISYNICFYNSPWDRAQDNSRHSHFFLQIIPRLGRLAGFEMATGCYINSVKPEYAAERLRKVIEIIGLF